MQQSQAVVQIEGAEDDCCMFAGVVIAHRGSLCQNFKSCLLQRHDFFERASEKTQRATRPRRSG